LALHLLTEWNKILEYSKHVTQYLIAQSLRQSQPDISTSPDLANGCLIRPGWVRFGSGCVWLIRFKFRLGHFRPRLTLARLMFVDIVPNKAILQSKAKFMLGSGQYGCSL